MVLNFGKKLIEGPTAEIFANDEVAAVYLGTGGDKNGGRRISKRDNDSVDDQIHLAAPEAESALCRR